MTKRRISFFLALCMLLSLFSTAAYTDSPVTLTGAALDAFLADVNGIEESIKDDTISDDDIAIEDDYWSEIEDTAFEDTIFNDESWDKPESVGAEGLNYAAGKSYTVVSNTTVSGEPSYLSGWADGGNALTDGVLESEAAGWGQVKYTGSLSVHTITLDLEAQYTDIDKVVFAGCRIKDNRQFANVTIEVSADGETFTAVEYTRTDVALENTFFDVVLNFADEVAARYVKLTCANTEYVFSVSEIQVIGEGNVADDTTSEETSEVADETFEVAYETSEVVSEEITYNYNDSDPTVETPHNYPDNYNRTWIISREGADEIAITFSSNTRTESSYDYIYIYDENNSLIGKYSGSSLASKTIYVTGDTVKIKFTSDYSNTYYGFAVSDIRVITEDFSDEPSEEPVSDEPVCEDAVASDEPSYDETSEVADETDDVTYTTEGQEETSVDDDVTDTLVSEPTISYEEEITYNYNDSDPTVETPHNYPDNYNRTWIICREGADEIAITFSSNTRTESSYDYIYIYDENNSLIGKYSGTSLASKTIFVPGDIVKIKFTSDGSNTDYGFAVSDIEAITYTYNYNDSDDTVESPHNYPDNYSHGWAIVREGADEIAITFSSNTHTETGCDYIYIYDKNNSLIGKYSGSSLASETIFVPGDIVKIKFTSNSSTTYYGFAVSDIEAITYTYNYNDSDSTVESPHNYPDNYSHWWAISREGADEIAITFSSNTRTESSYDFIYIYNKHNYLIGKYSGTSLASKTIYVPGDTVKIRFTSDYSNTYYGFAVSDITYAYVEESSEVPYQESEKEITFNYNDSDDTVESPHNYPNYYNHTWIICRKGADEIAITFSSNTRTEDSYDYIYIYDENNSLIGKYSGTSLASKTIFVTGDIVKIKFTSNSSTTYYGFAVSDIEAITYTYNYNDSDPTVESPHNYPDNYSHWWAIVREGADEIAITFSSNTYTQSNYDFIYIYDKNNSLIGKYSGSSLASKTIYVPGDIVKIKFTSNSSTTYYGFAVSDIRVITYTYNYNDSDPTVESPHNYPDNYSHWWAIVRDGADNIAITFSPETKTEAYYDYIYIYSSDRLVGKYSGVELASKTIKVSGDTVKIKFTSDYCYSDYGFAVSHIEIIVEDDTTSEEADYTGEPSDDTTWDDETSEDYWYDETSEDYWDDETSEDTTSEDHSPDDIRSSGTCGENLKWTLTYGGTLTICGHGEMKNYSSSYYSQPWSSYKSNITSVIIEDGVTNIGDYAFYNCYNLYTISIPDSVTSIGKNAFNSTDLYDTYSNWVNNVLYIDEYLIKAKSSVPSTYTIKSGTKAIAKEAFYNCSNLSSVTIPDSVTSIGENAFYNTALYNDNSNWKIGILYIGNYLIKANNDAVRSNCTIKSGIKVIADASFYDCSPLLSVNIPDSVIHIGNEAFYSCESLNTVTIGNAVKSIGNSAFYECSSLLSITIPDSVTSIGHYAFFSCGSLESVTIGNSVTFIGDYAFYSCNSLKSVTIGNSVTSIGDSAFKACDSLESVTIGNSVTSIGDSAFCCCHLLESVTIGNTVAYIGNNAFYHCEALKSITIPDSVTSIGNNAFYNCDSLESVTIGNSVTSIGNSAFYCCEALKSITIPDSVTSIGDSAFYYCDSLESVTIGNSVTSIGGYAFYYCEALKSITIPDSVTSIEHDAFSYCGKLLNITIGDSVRFIGTDAFYRTSLYNDVSNWENDVLYIGKYLIKAKTSIKNEYTIKSGTKAIAENAFYDCKSLTSVTVPDSVASIGGYAFYNCSSLKTLTIGDSVTSIGYGAFDNCSAFESIIIGDSVSSLSAFNFGSYTNLTTIVIGDSITTINDEAFSACNNLKFVTIGNSVTSIGKKAFAYCLVESIIIPDSVTYIGVQAFDYCNNLKSVTVGKGISYIGDLAFGYDDSGVIDGFVLMGYSNSPAEVYASENELTFIAINEIELPDGDYFMDSTTSTMPNVTDNISASSIISTLGEYGITATVTDKNGKALKNTDIVGTGCIVKTSSGEEYTVIVKGDVDGTGKITTTDYLQVKNAMTGKTNLQNEYFTAADTDGNKTITATDYLSIKSYLIGK